MIKNAIFDIGGVLIRTDYLLCTTAGSPEELKALHHTDERLEFDKGNLTEDEFRAHAEKMFSRKMEPEAFRRWWTEMIIEPIGPTVSWAERLKKDGVSIGVLSNTNCLHFPVFQSVLPMLKEKHVYASHIIRHRKPEPEAFQAVLDGMGIKAGETVFIDDKMHNCVQAKNLGMHAVLASSPALAAAGFNAFFGDLDGHQDAVS